MGTGVWGNRHGLNRLAFPTDQKFQHSLGTSRDSMTDAFISQFRQRQRITDGTEHLLTNFTDSFAHHRPACQLPRLRDSGSIE